MTSLILIYTVVQHPIYAYMTSSDAIYDIAGCQTSEHFKNSTMECCKQVFSMFMTSLTLKEILVKEALSQQADNVIIIIRDNK